MSALEAADGGAEPEPMLGPEAQPEPEFERELSDCSTTRMSETVRVDEEAAEKLPDLKLGPEVGRGQFSTVFVGRRSVPPPEATQALQEEEGVEDRGGSNQFELVAVKRQHLRQQEALDEYLARELEVMGKLHHPNVVRFLGSHDIQSTLGWSLFVITEFAPGGDLMTLLAKPEPLGDRFRASLALGICRGLDHVHSSGFIHRDIKSENVLLAVDWCPMLADFGMARPMEGDERQFMTICGTDEYMAPELLFDEGYGFGADVYGLGMVLCEVLARKPVGRDGFAERAPRNAFRLDEEELRAGLGAAVGDGALGSLVELAMQCLEYEPESRVTAADAVGWVEDFVQDLEGDGVGPINDLPTMIERETILALAAEVQPDEAYEEVEPGFGPDEDRAAVSSTLFVDALSSPHVRRSLARGSIELKKGPMLPQFFSKGSISVEMGPGIRLHYGGWLFKKSTGLFRQWHRRWFELDSDAMRWFKTPPQEGARAVPAPTGLRGRASTLAHNQRGEIRRASGCICFSMHMRCRATETKANRFALFIRSASGDEILLREFAARTPLDVNTWVTLIEAAIMASTNDCMDPEALLAGENVPHAPPADELTPAGGAASGF